MQTPPRPGTRCELTWPELTPSLLIVQRQRVPALGAGEIVAVGHWDKRLERIGALGADRVINEKTQPLAAALDCFYGQTGGAGKAFWEKAGFKVIGTSYEEWPKDDDWKATVESQAKAKGMSKKEAWTTYHMACDL